MFFTSSVAAKRIVLLEQWEEEQLPLDFFYHF